MDSIDHHELIRQWIVKADRDIEIVERELRLVEEPLTDILCFHCQQAVEKYLKAYLISRMIKPPKTHVISILIEECSQIDPHFKTISDLAYMTEYAIELRYPDDFSIPDIDEMRNAYADALRVKQLVKDQINR